MRTTRKNVFLSTGSLVANAVRERRRYHLLMRAATGYVVKIRRDRIDDFEGSFREYGSFAEPVPDFSHGRGSSLVCFVSAEPGKVTHVAEGKIGVRAGTNRVRLNLENILELPQPVQIQAILRNVGRNVIGHVRKRLRDGGALPPRSSDNVVDAVLKLSPAAGEILNRHSGKRRSQIARISKGRREALAAQKEAVSTALTIAGIDRNVLLRWTPEWQGASFLDGLPTTRVLEDQMIWHDQSIGLPGLQEVKRSITGVARFESDSVVLEVVVANRTALEMQTGADLIYFNTTFKSFVLVQYKAMEKDTSLGAIFRLPNTQLASELARMRKTLSAVGKAAHPRHRDHFRLNANPFFLKLCPRIIFDPNSTSLSSGMYIPLGMWHHIEHDSDLLGPKGGRAVSFANVGRHMTNTEFADLVRAAWIGTTPQQTAILGPVIEDVLKAGRAVVIAVGSKKVRTDSL